LITNPVTPPSSPPSPSFRHSSNIIENVMGTVRRVCRNVKHWRSPSMAMRWTAAAMMEAKKGFRRLKAHNQLPVLRAALDRRSAGTSTGRPIAQIAEAA
jgi:hypothetical protein